MNQNKRLKDTGTLVRDIFMEHPDWNARQIYDRYLILIGDTNKAVTLNAIQKQLEKINKTTETPEYQALQAPWHMGTLEDYPLHPEALFSIIAVQNYCERVRNNPDPPLGEYPPITVWQALWIARLYVFTPYFQSQWEHDKKIHKWDLKDWCLISLYRWSRAYMHYEEICKLAETYFDTTELDKALRQGAIPIIASGIQINGEIINSLGTVVFIKPGNRVSMIPPYKEK